MPCLCLLSGLAMTVWEKPAVPSPAFGVKQPIWRWPAPQKMKGDSDCCARVPSIGTDLSSACEAD
jgi:hypothetical protein